MKDSAWMKFLKVVKPNYTEAKPSEVVNDDFNEMMGKAVSWMRSLPREQRNYLSKSYYDIPANRLTIQQITAICTKEGAQGDLDRFVIDLNSKKPYPLYNVCVSDNAPVDGNRVPVSDAQDEFQKQTEMWLNDKERLNAHLDKYDVTPYKSPDGHIGIEIKAKVPILTEFDRLNHFKKPTNLGSGLADRNAKRVTNHPNDTDIRKITKSFYRSINDMDRYVHKIDISADSDGKVQIVIQSSCPGLLVGKQGVNAKNLSAYIFKKLKLQNNIKYTEFNPFV